MFTVKWIVKHTCGEVTRIFEAAEVSVAYRDMSRPTKAGWMVDGREVEAALLIMDSKQGLSGRSLADGLVYVMNEAGATVGKYLLSHDVLDPECRRLVY